MLAAWTENGRIGLRDVPAPEAAPGEARIRVEFAGICSTDHGLVDGRYDYTGVPGHEFVGFVEDGADALAGRRVIGKIVAECGLCAVCAAGRASHCPERTVLGITDRPGAFAERTRLPAVCLSEVPDAVPSRAAVFAEPLAAALQILEQVEIARDDRVLLVGPGKLGQLVARVLDAHGCRLVVAGRSERSLSALPSHVAGVRTADLDETDFDVVVECTGDPAGLLLGADAVRPGGTLVLKSTYRGSVDFDFSKLVVDEKRVVGSRCGPMDEALRWLADGRVDPTPLIDAEYAFRDFDAAFAKSREPGVRKVLLDMTGI